MVTDISGLPVKMQGFQPCCVEAALTQAVEYYWYKQTGVYMQLSMRFLAALTANRDGVNYAKSGTSLVVAADLIKNIGICTEATYPSTVTLSDDEFIDLTQIPQEAYAEAAKYKVPDFTELKDVSWETVNQAINDNSVVVTCLLLDKSWYLSNQPLSNPDPLPPPSSWLDPSISRHATLSYGYDDTYRYVRNSFGLTFGSHALPPGDARYTRDYQPYIYAAGYIPQISPADRIAVLAAEDEAKGDTKNANILFAIYKFIKSFINTPS